MDIIPDYELGLESVENAEGKEISLKDIKLPYVLKNRIIFSPGTHNNLIYTPEAIKRGFYNTQWNHRTKSLYHAHKDEFTYNPATGEKDLHVGAEVDDYAGTVENLRYEDDGIIRGDIYVWDLNTAIKLMSGAKFGISPRGKALREGNVVKDLIIENWAITVNPAIKTTYLNSEDLSQFNYAYAMSELDSEKEFEKYREVKNMDEKDLENIETEVENAAEKTEDAEPKTENTELKTSKTPEEQLKELQEKYDALLKEVEELKKKKKEYPYPAEVEEGKAKKNEKEKYPEYPEATEDKPDELSEDVIDMINSMSTEELASWKELVKKYGIKEAAKIYKKEKEMKEMKETAEKLKEVENKINELNEKIKEEQAVPDSSIPKIEPEKAFEMSDREIDDGMAKYIEKLIGV